MDKPAAYRRKSAEQRQRELIEAGIACLGDGGMSGFTIDRICRAARVSRGLVNHHFRTKEDLLLRIYAEMTAHLVEAPPLQGPEAQLRHVIESNFDAASFRRSNLRAWLSIWGEIATNPALHELHEQRYQAYKFRIADAIGRLAVGEGNALDASSIARQLIAMIDGLWLEYCLHAEDFTLDDARRDCYRLLRSQGIDLAPTTPEARDEQG